MRTDLLLDRNEKLIIASSWQDVEPFLENNDELRRDKQSSDWGKHIGSVPNVILLRWFYEEHDRGNNIRWGSKEFQEMVWKKLNDPEWAYLRVD